MSETKSLLNGDYLRQGITALSRGHGGFDGHHGACLIAAYYFSRRPEMEPSAQPLLKAQLDKVARKYPDYFTPRPPATSDPALIEKIPEALGKSIHLYTSIGHNVVFASLALKAMRDVPDMVTPEIISGLCDLLNAFTTETTDDVMGIKLDELMAGEDVTKPPYETPADIATFTLTELVGYDKIYATQGWWGFLGHMLTHAHGLIELSRLGYPDVARRGHDAHRLHAKSLRRWRHYQGNDMQAVSPLSASPFTSAFWERHLDNPNPLEWHSFKYPYHTYELLEYVDDPELKKGVLDRLSCLTHLGPMG